MIWQKYFIVLVPDDPPTGDNSTSEVSELFHRVGQEFGRLQRVGDELVSIPVETKQASWAK